MVEGSQFWHHDITTQTKKTWKYIFMKKSKFHFHKYVRLRRVVWVTSVTYLPMHISIPVETPELTLCSPHIKFPHVRPRVIVWWPLIAGQGGAVSGLSTWLTNWLFAVNDAVTYYELWNVLSVTGKFFPLLLQVQTWHFLKK